MRRALGGALGLALPALLAIAPPTAAAQWPGRLEGRVVEAGSGAPVEAALVAAEETGSKVLSDAAGRFEMRGLEPGRLTLHVSRMGYAPATRTVEVENGRTAHVSLELRVVPVAVSALEVRHRAAPGATVLDRGAIERSGARTAGDLLGRVASAVVRQDGPTGAQTVSLRGAGADAVLVLLDGVPLNDPVTGEADLSAVPADRVESLVVLRGARSARYGPRAEAGVILIETRRRAEPAIEAATGSLGTLAGRGEWGGMAGGLGWVVGAEARSVRGGFDFAIPPEAGGGRSRRQNDDLTEAGGYAGAGASLWGGELGVRAGYEWLERGLPGKGFAPSDRARQELRRSRASLTWRRSYGRVTGHVALAGQSQTVRFRDPAPPFGTAYDDTTALREIELRSEVEWQPAVRSLRSLGLGWEASWQQVDAAPLAASALGERLDLGVFSHAALAWQPAGIPISLAAQARLDRDEVADRWSASRAITLGAELGPVAVHIANRSSYSPPSLGDQFFRDAVGVEANPDLRPERVPMETEVGLASELRAGGLTLDGSLTAYQGDIRDMIIWAPDYRFVWSPRNLDTRRRGAEAQAGIDLPGPALRVDVGYSYSRITYDRPGDDDAVQVVYRPRHSTTARAEWSPDPWRIDVEARFTGTRYPAPSPVNALPGFWTVDLGVARTVRVGGHAVDAAIHLDRALDEKSSLIFGFPEPGRLVRLSLRWRRRGDDTL